MVEATARTRFASRHLGPLRAGGCILWHVRAVTFLGGWIVNDFKGGLKVDLRLVEIEFRSSHQQKLSA